MTDTGKNIEQTVELSEGELGQASGGVGVLFTVVGKSCGHCKQPIPWEAVACPFCGSDDYVYRDDQGGTRPKKSTETAMQYTPDQVPVNIPKG